MPDSHGGVARAAFVKLRNGSKNQRLGGMRVA